MDTLKEYELSEKVKPLNGDGSYNQHFVDWLIDKNKALREFLKAVQDIDSNEGWLDTYAEKVGDVLSSYKHLLSSPIDKDRTK